jgi:hypothetical protein
MDSLKNFQLNLQRSANRESVFGLLNEVIRSQNTAEFQVLDDKGNALDSRISGTLVQGYIK